METKSNGHRNVFCALASAQMAMRPLIKGAVNPAFKAGASGGRYADLADLVSAVREPLGLNGLAFFHTMIDGTSMQTSLVHGESETRIDCTVPLIVAKNDMQGMKSATTYAKRIGLESVTGIAPEDDDGNAAVVAAPKAESPRPEAFDAMGRAKTIIAAIEKAANMDALKSIWTANGNDLKAIKFDSHGMFDTIANAKAKRAADLIADDNLDGDTIPYEGK